MPASCAMAGRWSAVFDEPPKAMSTVMAFLNASRVMISLGLTSFSTRAMMAMPALFARWIRCAWTAGIVPFPRRPMPRASLRQFIELAVNIPEHEPAPGQAHPSSSVELLLRHGACRHPSYPFKNIDEIDGLAPEASRKHGSAAHEDRGDVEAQGSHHHAGDDFVAVRHEHETVEGVSLAHHLYGIGDRAPLNRGSTSCLRGSWRCRRRCR